MVLRTNFNEINARAGITANINLCSMYWKGKSSGIIWKCQKKAFRENSTQKPSPIINIQWSTLTFNLVKVYRLYSTLDVTLVFLDQFFTVVCFQIVFGRFLLLSRIECKKGRKWPQFKSIMILCFQKWRQNDWNFLGA